MYIWIGCKLPQAFETELRELVLRFNEALHLDISGFSLPQHISLKISFPVNDSQANAVLDCLADVLRQEAPFYVNLSAIEQAGNILWLRAENSPRLCALHDKLDELLLEGFSVGQHPYDKAFCFHSTICMGDDPDALRHMAQALSDCALLKRLKIDTFLLGTSPDGTGGSYRVVRQITANRAVRP